MLKPLPKMADQISYLCNYDVVIQLITASFFALSGLSFFQDKFISQNSEFKSKNKVVLSYLSLNNDISISEIKHHFKLIRLKCYYNLMTCLYPNRFNEIFYKGGVYGLFLLLYIAFVRSDLSLDIYRFLPVALYSFLSITLLSRRLFCRINDRSVIYDMAINSTEDDIQQLIYPFSKNIKKVTHSSNYYKVIKDLTLYFYKCINPKYIRFEGRNVFGRCVIHALIFMLLLHLDWFGIHFNELPNWISNNVHAIFNDSFVINHLPFNRKNLEIIVTFFIVVLVILPYIVLVIFYAKNTRTHKRIEEDADEALISIKKMQKKDDKVVDNSRDKLIQRLKNFEEEEN